MTRKGWTELDDLRKAVVEISVEDRTPENPTAFATTQDVARRLALTWGANGYDSDAKLAKRHDQKIRKLLAELFRRGEIARLDSGFPRAHAKWTATNLGVQVDRSRRRENRGDGSRVRTQLDGPVERPEAPSVPSPPAPSPGPQTELDFEGSTAEPVAANRRGSLAEEARRLGARIYRETLARDFGRHNDAVHNATRALAELARIFDGLGL